MVLRLITSVSELKAIASTLRKQLEGVFGPETAAPSSAGDGISGGQCAAVAAIFKSKYGGSFVSAIVSGESHWFNRITLPSGQYDVDITGDQFGRPVVQVQLAGSLYEGTRERADSEMNEETRRRSQLLAQRVGLNTLTLP